jgi:pantoate--beta-alanine ligase
MAQPVVIKDPTEMREHIRDAIKNSESIGFVPTMGALHAGHRSLVERARRENDVVVVSLYVNPTQFAPGEDFERYPRTFDADVKLCGEAGADFIFAPDNLYDENSRTWVQVGQLDETLEGLSRPGHFRGVATVVTKLLSIVSPDRAYFGRKDAQQLVIIQRLVRDLNLGCEIVPCDTVREADGLAMSSRNRYLSPSERKQALAIPRALQWCREKVSHGERSVVKLMEGMAQILSEQPDIEIDYISFVNAETLEDLKKIRGDVLAAIAAKVGNTRLIDNARFDNVV